MEVNLLIKIRMLSRILLGEFPKTLTGPSIYFKPSSILAKQLLLKAVVYGAVYKYYFCNLGQVAQPSCASKFI